jgi:DNA repair exonuclease SbcCD nuclease subunit
MTDNLFSKAVSLTDIHFGRSTNSPVANQDNLDFIDWFIEEAKTWGADTCFMCGDWHDNRNAIAVSTLNYSLAGMQKLNDAFKVVHWIPGNHDLLYRNKRDVSSIEFGRSLPNINIIREPTTVGGVTILPWLVNDEPKKMKGLKSRYIFGHLELPGFMMNAKVPMPAHGGEVTADDFQGNEYVFSGHFHFRQTQRNVVYIGNVFPFNFADTWDEDRGMMFLEWGKDPFFKAWPEQPVFRNFKLSQLLNEPEKYLKDKLTARVTLDIDISYEEAQMIKDTYMKGTGVRRMELVHQPRNTEEQAFNADDVVFQSVDQIVTEGLLDVKSKGLDPAKLVEIYKALPNL